jgi:hypothetical protein
VVHLSYFSPSLKANASVGASDRTEMPSAECRDAIS